MIAGAAIAGLFSGSAAVQAATASKTQNDAGKSISTFADKEKKGATHDCAGKNACKGQGGCKTGDNGCKGKNSCKGKGGCAVKKGDKGAKGEATATPTAS
jgi:hypothetical protein